MDCTRCSFCSPAWCSRRTKLLEHRRFGGRCVFGLLLLYMGSVHLKNLLCLHSLVDSAVVFLSCIDIPGRGTFFFFDLRELNYLV